MIEVSAVGLLGSFAAGVVSFLSPCVLPLVPGYVGYLVGHSAAGRREHRRGAARQHVLALSAFFVAGFSSVFVALGASATMLGQLLLEYRHAASVVGGSVIVLFGLLMTGLLPLRLLQRDFHVPFNVVGGNPLSAYVVGLAFGFGWSPCVGPVLTAILLMAGAEDSAAEGAKLLFVYSLGIGVPFLIAAAFASAFMRALSRVKARLALIEKIMGGFLIAAGVLIFTGQMPAIAFWLIETFPALGKIG
jgi:cytochrome c-type biogenesis protein